MGYNLVNVSSGFYIFIFCVVHAGIYEVMELFADLEHINLVVYK